MTDIDWDKFKLPEPGIPVWSGTATRNILAPYEQPGDGDILPAAKRWAREQGNLDPTDDLRVMLIFLDTGDETDDSPIRVSLTRGGVGFTMTRSTTDPQSQEESL